MTWQLLIIILLFVFSLILLLSKFEVGFSVLLILSVLLHKELFSIYRWDVLPVRIFMLSFLAFTVIRIFAWFQHGGSLKKAFSYLKHPFISLLILMWLVNAVSIIFSKNLFSSLSLLGFFTTIVALGIYLYLKYLQNSDSAMGFIRKYIFIVFGLTLFAFFQAGLYAKTGVIIGALWNIPGNIPRLGATFWDVNHFGALLAGLLPVLGVTILVAQGKKSRVLYSLMFIAMTFLLFLTNSRTAWIIAFIAFISFISLLLFKKLGYKGVAIVAGVLILFSVLFAWEYSDRSSPIRAKVKNYFHYRIDSFASHLMLLQGSYEIFEEYPYLGGGYGGFFEHFSKTDIAAEYFGRDPAALNTRVPAHTIWGEALAETGFIGFSVLAAFVLLLLATFLYLALNSADKTGSLMGAAMFSSFLGWFSAGIFYSYKSEFFWLTLFLYFIYSVGSLGEHFSLKTLVTYFLSSNKTFLAVLAVLAVPLIFITLGKNHLIPWDEAIYAQIAKNMVQKGECIVQYWRPDTAWYEKPPLFMWLQAVFMNILPIGSLAVKLPSAILGLSTVFLVYLFGKKLFNRTAGFLAAFSLLTTFHFLYYSRIGMLDVAVTFFITLSLYFYYLAGERDSLKYWILSGLAIGLGVMTKGIIGLLPFPIIALNEFHLFFRKERRLDRRLVKKYASLVLVCVLVSLPWHLEMYRRFGKEFVNTYIGYHVLYRAISDIENKGKPFWWYLEVMKVSMRIWFIAFLGAFPLTLFYAIKKSRRSAFLLIWLLFIFLFFSVSISKLVWYIMPIYPVAALMVGNFLEKSLGFIMSKIRFLNTQVFKALVVFVLVFGGLFYLFINRGLVYVSDLTGSQAQLLQLKNENFGNEEIVYVDRINLPVILFYLDGPFQETDFSPLQETIRMTPIDGSLIFITKESRLRKFREEKPDLRLIEERNEWVLGYLPSEMEHLTGLYNDADTRYKSLERKVIKYQTEGKVVPEEVDLELKELQVTKDKLRAEIMEKALNAGLDISKLRIN